MALLKTNDNADLDKALKSKQIAVIGVGKLGEALISGLISSAIVDSKQIEGSVAHESSLERVRQRLGINCKTNNCELVRDKDIILLAVKPQNMETVLHEIKDVLSPKQWVISVAASVSTDYIYERISKSIPVIRAMPNTPCLIGSGMTAISKGEGASTQDIQIAEAIFNCVGKTVIVDEYLMDGVTALSASGPAYLYVIIESLAEAGVKLGINRDISTLLVAQTMLGAANMVLESKAHPALLKDTVTTPAGCTIDGLMELEEGKLRVTLIKAVVKAATRAKELVKGII
jgi:pyrroline-5-carboxylate reductase